MDWVALAGVLAGLAIVVTIAIAVLQWLPPRLLLERRLIRGFFQDLKPRRVLSHEFYREVEKEMVDSVISIRNEANAILERVGIGARNKQRLSEVVAACNDLLDERPFSRRGLNRWRYRLRGLLEEIARSEKLPKDLVPTIRLDFSWSRTFDDPNPEARAVCPVCGWRVSVPSGRVDQIETDVAAATHYSRSARNLLTKAAEGRHRGRLTKKDLLVGLAAEATTAQRLTTAGTALSELLQPASNALEPWELDGPNDVTVTTGVLEVLDAAFGRRWAKGVEDLQAIDVLVVLAQETGGPLSRWPALGQL